MRTSSNAQLGSLRSISVTGKRASLIHAHLCLFHFSTMKLLTVLVFSSLVLGVSSNPFSFVREAALGKMMDRWPLGFTWSTLKDWSHCLRLCYPVWQDAPGILRSISIKGLNKAGSTAEVSNEQYMKQVLPS